jgi:hypothetical protein
MARPALSVVYAHERDDEVAALRARVAQLERSMEDICWFDRLRQCQQECELQTRAFVLTKVSEFLIWTIEQQRWGVRERVVSPLGEVAPGLLNFDYEYELENALVSLLADAVQDDDDLRPIEYFMHELEDDLSLPRGSFARLPAGAVFR